MHMNNNKRLSTVDMRTKTKIKVCSTPERRIESPTIDNDSICDSETASPIQFLCTQDDADVFYNFYTPKSEGEKTQFKTTPVSRKTKKPVRLQTDKQLPKRKIIKPSQQRNKLIQELRELNQNVHELVKKSSTDSNENLQSEEDMFSDTGDISPRSGIMFRKRCLRKNVLSSKFIKTEPECGLESDDSINECLIQVSQAVEEKLNSEKKNAKRQCFDTFNQKGLRTAPGDDMDQDSMDDILSNIKLESPLVKKLKHCDSTRYNDSFDSLLENLNDSTLDRLSQVPLKNAIKTRDVSKVKLEEPTNDSLFFTSFTRHNSMPVSPSTNNKPSTSGTTFGRYKSMPFNKSSEDVQDGSQITYTQDEISKKRQQAREKLLAKGMLRSSKQQLSSQTQSTNNNNIQLHVDDTQNTLLANKCSIPSQKSGSNPDMKLIIEKKRQDALMKLRKRQAQCR